MTTNATKIPSLSQVGSFLSGVRRRLFGAPSDTLPRIDAGKFRRYAEFFVNQVTDHAQTLVSDGQLGGLNKWLASMNQEIERLHVTAYTIGRGGVANLTNADFVVIDDIVREQQAYLRNWYNEMKQAAELPSESYIVNRSKMYLGAANETLQRATVQYMGLPELPFYPGVETACHRNCKCAWQWTKLEGDGNYDVKWTLAQAEHCETCIARARVANPLQIRNYEIVNADRYRSSILYYD